jgi:hypothetical protein
MKYAAIIVFVFSLFLTGCEKPAPKNVKVKVERVFQQQPGSYSFLVREGNELVPRTAAYYRSPSDYCNLYLTSHLLPDLAAGEPMYVEFNYHYEEGGNGKFEGQYAEEYIHIHSAADVDTTGYTVWGKPPITVHPKVIE